MYLHGGLWMPEQALCVMQTSFNQGENMKYWRVFSLRFILTTFLISLLSGSLLMFTRVEPVEAKPALALPSYNRDAAVKWANGDNYDDGSYHGNDRDYRYCTTYITKAMRAGGIVIPVIHGNGELAKWLREHRDYWEIRPKEQLEKGDILFLNKGKDIPDDLNISSISHSVFITGPGTYSAWNAERKNKKFSWFNGVYKSEKGVHLKTGASPSQPSVWQNGKSYMIKSANDTKLVLDVDGGKTANGTKIIQWESHGDANQIWKVESFPNGYFRLHSALDNRKCLVVLNASRDNGGKIILWDCSPNGQDNEWWQPVPQGNNYSIRNNRSGKALDVPSGDHTWGLQIIQWEAHTGLNQQWTFIQK